MAHETLSKSTSLIKRNLLLISFVSFCALKFELLNNGIKLPFITSNSTTDTTSILSTQQTLSITLFIILYLLISFSIQAYGDYKNKKIAATDEFIKFKKDNLLLESIEVEKQKLPEELTRFLKPTREQENIDLKHSIQNFMLTNDEVKTSIEAIFEQFKNNIKSDNKKLLKSVFIAGNELSSFENYNDSIAAKIINEVEVFLDERVTKVYSDIESQLEDTFYKKYLTLRLILDIHLPIGIGLIMVAYITCSY